MLLITIQMTVDPCTVQMTIPDIAFRLSVDTCFVQVTIYLTSPSGTRSTLLTRRVYDRSTDGFNSWSFMSTHCWGESPNGVWTLEVRNGDSVSKYAVCRYALCPKERKTPNL